MASKIAGKIKNFSVVKPRDDSGGSAARESAAAHEDCAAIEHMNERVERPGMLLGATYKIKPPVSDHALYITVNDIVLNPDTDHEVHRPYCPPVRRACWRQW